MTNQQDTNTEAQRIESIVLEYLVIEREYQQLNAEIGKHEPYPLVFGSIQKMLTDREVVLKKRKAAFDRRLKMDNLINQIADDILLNTWFPVVSEDGVKLGIYLTRTSDGDIVLHCGDWSEVERLENKSW